MTVRKASRRTFLASAAALAGCAATGAARKGEGSPHAGPDAPPKGPAAAPALATPPAAEPPSSLPGGSGPWPGVDAAAIAQAEKLVAIEQKPAERELMASGFHDQVDWAVQRRKVELPFELAPELGFHPRLPEGARQGAAIHVKLPAPRSAPLPKGEHELATAPAVSLGAWIRARQISSLELTRLYLKRLQRVSPTLLCTITLCEERALAEARRADAELARGHSRGPLHGVPYGVKDLLDTAHIRTTWGAEPFKDRVPAHDAEVVKRLGEAGGVLLAKLSLGALANGDVWYEGQTRNPWLPAEGSSGSSAGSAAATASGAVGFAIGSETLGSIVSPSMRCGLTGLRPTFGRVPRTGAMPLCWSLDKLGPLARSVEDCAAVLAAISGPDGVDEGCAPMPLSADLSRAGADLGELRVAYDPRWYDGKDALPEDRQALEAVRRLGVRLREVRLPDLPYDSLVMLLTAEAAAAFEQITLDHRIDHLRLQTVDAWPNTFRSARFISAVDYVQADRLRRRVVDEMARLYRDVDLLVTPSLSGPMLTVGNFAGLPSLTLRTGYRTITKARTDFDFGLPAQPLETPARVPHGITLVGAPSGEGATLRLGKALQDALAVSSEWPVVG